MVSKEGQPEPSSDDDPAIPLESKKQKLERPSSLTRRRDVIGYPSFLSKIGETTNMQPNFSTAPGSQGSHSHPQNGGLQDQCIQPLSDKSVSLYEVWL
jgi:hypothetical protein